MNHFAKQNDTCTPLNSVSLGPLRYVHAFRLDIGSYSLVVQPGTTVRIRVQSGLIRQSLLFPIQLRYILSECWKSVQDRTAHTYAEIRATNGTFRRYTLKSASWF